MHHTPLLLLAALVASAFAAPTHISTPSGFKVPLSLVRTHVPSHAVHELHHTLFEHDLEKNELRSTRHTIALDDVAPHRGPIRERAGFAVHRGNGEYADLQEAGHNDAYVRRGDGHVYAYARDDDGKDVLVAGFAPGIALRPLSVKNYPGIYINYDRPAPGDAPLKRQETKTEALKLEHTAARQLSGGCGPTDPDAWYEAAFSFDKSFCARFDNVERFAVAALQAAVLAASVPYQEQSCIRLALVHVDAFCSDDATDPFAAPSNPTAEAILDQYRMAYQSAPFNTVRRDVAIFASGYENQPAGGAAGLASLGTFCNDEQNFGWVEILTPSLVAHEIAHTLGPDHDDTERHILVTQAQLNDPLRFSATTINFFAQALASPLNTCVNRDAPVCDNTCPNGASCTNGVCVSPPSALPGNNGVLCSRIADYQCVTTITESTGNFARDCPSQFNFVQRTAVNASDYSIFCCSAPTATQENTQIVVPGQLVPGLRTATGAIIPGFVSDTIATETVTLITASFDVTCGGTATTAPPATTATTTAAAATTAATAAPATAAPATAAPATAAPATAAPATAAPATAAPATAAPATAPPSTNAPSGTDNDVVTVPPTTMTTAATMPPLPPAVVLPGSGGVPFVVLPAPGPDGSAIPTLPGVGSNSIPTLPGETGATGGSPPSLPGSPSNSVPVLPSSSIPVLPAARR